MTLTKHVLKLLSIIVLLFFIGYFLESSPYIADLLGSQSELFSDFFQVFVSFSIFAMTWYAYSKSKDNHSLFLGWAFLVIGVLEQFHTLSHPFLPDFITPNSNQKSTIFLGETWLISALFFLTSAYIYRNTLPRLINRYVLLASAILLSFISLITTLFYPDYLLLQYLGDSSFLLKFLLPLTSVIILYASYLYVRRIQKTWQENLIFLIYSFIIIIFSDLLYFSYGISAHLLRITAFFFVYLALYKSSVEMPYEKLLAEERLRGAAEEKYRNLFDSASDAIITVDLEDRVTSWNKAAETIFGWRAEEVMGKKLPIVPPEMQVEREQIINDVLSGEPVTWFETVRLCKDRTKIDVSLTTSPILNTDKKIISFSIIIRDITERKRTEEAIKKLSSVVVQSADSVIIVNKDDIIEYVNPAFERITGYTREEVIGKTSNILKSGKHDKKFYKKLYETIHSRRVFRAEFINKKKNGEIYIVESTITPIKDTQGNITHFVATERDITEDKKAEELRLENERLEYASKAKSEFLATMSHELRTPLNTIIGFSELLKQKMAGELNRKQEHYLDNILKSSKHLLDLINDILDLSKVEAGKMELVIEKMSVPEIINESMVLIKEKAMNHQVILKKELDPKLDVIEADRLRFKQVLFNLLSNAVKFSKPEGGIITITAKKKGGMAKLSVSDTGIGIREEDAGKLFKTFEQLNSGISRNYGGTGLGLAISKRLVELHRGNIWVESKFGVGSTFYFTIPINRRNN